jgi:hypothetical protein
MGSSEEYTVGKCSVFWLIILSAVVSAAAVILVILLASWGDTGMAGSGSIVAGSCDSAYLTAKYADMPTINTAIFICSCIAALSSTIVVLVFIRWMCKCCTNTLQPLESTKGGLFFLLSLTMLAAVAPVGYYLSFLLELSHCTTTTINIGNAVITLILAAIVLLTAFIVLIIVLCQNYTLEEDKYKQVSSSHTEPNE